jgi:hypothetical protein
MIVGILHRKDSWLTGRRELCVETRLQKTRTNFMDLRDARYVCYGDFVWCNSNYVAEPLVKCVHVEDPSPGQNVEA